MSSNTLGIFTFFMGGVFIYAMIRHAKPWPDKHQNLFWLAVFSPLVLTLFVLPGHVNKGILNGINAIIAGLVASEYIRTRYGSKFEKFKEFGQEVKQNRKRALREVKPSKTTEHKEKRKKD